MGPCQRSKQLAQHTQTVWTSREQRSADSLSGQAQLVSILPEGVAVARREECTLQDRESHNVLLRGQGKLVHQKGPERHAAVRLAPRMRRKGTSISLSKSCERWTARWVRLRDRLCSTSSRSLT